ncbi:leucine zipper putative tumor suppressor 2 homolog [Branchiostoma floridae]|uniref:Leucine zipper putative tumor suppressor 2 homolog n=1 Tax=Branchiostoma floridae TaxID=7739 RepID=A0A9J7L0G8_BRAFL|nr:leucine zipper putative tumor suppressor 2 homolog [Branchiostoma floridae]XP_035672925.1 leucine zipper putative tumor suppressor 2 homolog [Branchiostoma floridae]XP_035672926.1 leucine zipper putative tumor suppressor 2 homolog [Branchiostoma floridae]XP_035672927.1 leucine zipper putative tumor suppressor 2 homolog [Branchiostoma floridae]XP_035672928.1 leucine zipper putative tumor suppressor 2 homolog [Branchiostoma floridae]XP_035672929.1 leucine zipper putative tumor suppressor 2 ho
MAQPAYSLVMSDTTLLETSFLNHSDALPLVPQRSNISPCSTIMGSVGSLLGKEDKNSNLPVQKVGYNREGLYDNCYDKHIYEDVEMKPAHKTGTLEGKAPPPKIMPFSGKLDKHTEKTVIRPTAFKPVVPRNRHSLQYFPPRPGNHLSDSRNSLQIPLFYNPKAQDKCGLQQNGFHSVQNLSLPERLPERLPENLQQPGSRNSFSGGSCNGGTYNTGPHNGGNYSNTGSLNSTNSHSNTGSLNNGRIYSNGGNYSNGNIPGLIPNGLPNGNHHSGNHYVDSRHMREGLPPRHKAPSMDRLSSPASRSSVTPTSNNNHTPILSYHASMTNLSTRSNLTPVQSHTPRSSLTPQSNHTPVPSHTPRMNHTPSSTYTAGSNHTMSNGHKESSSSEHSQWSTISEDSTKELEEKVKEKESELVQLRKTMEENEMIIYNVYEEKQRKWEKEISDTKRDCEKKIKAAQQRASRTEQVLQLQIYQLQQEKKKISHEMSQLLQDNDKLDRQLDTYRSQTTETTQKLDETKWEMCQKSGEISLLKQQLKEAKSELSLKTNDVIASRGTIKDIKTELSEKDSQVTALQDKVSEKNAEILHYQDEVAKQQCELDNLSDTLRKREDELMDLKDSYRQVKEDLSNVRAELDNKIKEEQLISQCDEVKERRKNKERDLIESLKVEVQRLRNELKTVHQRHDAQLMEFERERAIWQEEKEKVIHYQKQLQLNYVQMFRKTKNLEKEVQQLTLELERRDLESDSV